MKTIKETRFLKRRLMQIFIPFVYRFQYKTLRDHSGAGTYVYIQTYVRCTHTHNNNNVGNMYNSTTVVAAVNAYSTFLSKKRVIAIFPTVIVIAADPADDC